MSRENELGEHRQGGESVQTLLETIIEDVVQAAAIPERDWRVMSRFPRPPLAIPVSEGTVYRATQAGVDAAHRLAD